MSPYTGAVPDTLTRVGEQEQTAPCAWEPDLWFEKGGPNREWARRQCLYSCPLRAQCAVSCMEAEKGEQKLHRFGIYGALSRSERFNADPSVNGQQDQDRDLADGEAACGTYPRLLHHLVQGETVDATCWLAQLVRTHPGAVTDGLLLPGRLKGGAS